ncbi:antitoxin, partial [Candidatus Pacearchaeota archaeon CG10_big_fil_rev_8_21_14_0_10_30_48]
MVQSIIDINEDEDRILNIVKAKYGLKNKSQAVAFITRKYGDSFLEPELKP